MKLNKYLNEINIKWIYVLQDKKNNNVFSTTTSSIKLIEIMNKFTKENYINQSLAHVEASGKDEFGKGNNKLIVYKLPIL